jgi:hypothetical protein
MQQSQCPIVSLKLPKSAIHMASYKHILKKYSSYIFKTMMSLCEPMMSPWPLFYSKLHYLPLLFLYVIEVIEKYA